MVSIENIEKIANQLKEDIKQYRNARTRVENSQNNTTSSVQAGYKLRELITTPNFDSLLKTSILIETDTKQLWKKIIQSKLQVVNILGGNALAQEIAKFMANFDDEIIRENEKIGDHHEQSGLEGTPSYNEIYNFEGAFDYLATGIIEDWYS